MRRSSLLVRRFFSTQYMVKPERQIGEITPTKEAYSNSLRIATPAVAEMVTIALMSMMDTVMVSQLGLTAIAAVALTGQPRMIFLSPFFALYVAVTAIVSRNKGAGDPNAAKSCLRQAIIITVFAGLLITIASIFISRPLMMLAGADHYTLDLSTSFLRISMYALTFQVLAGVINAAQRAVGNTKISMQVNIVANAVKVLFNFLLIEGRFGFPRLGVDGAAVSLVIAAFISFTLAAFSLLRKNSYLYLPLRREDWRLDIPMLKIIGRLTGGGVLEQVSLRVGFFAYARVVAGLGYMDLAVHQIGMQLMNLSFTFADGIAKGITALVGQSLGRNRPDLSIMYGKIGMRLAICASVTLGILSILTRYQFPRLFADNPYVIEYAAWIILILAFLLPIQTSQVVMGGSLRGAGDTRFVAMTMLVTVGFLRPVGGFVLTYTFGFGLTGAWVAIMIDQSVRLILLFTRFSRGRWITERL